MSSATPIEPLAGSITIVDHNEQVPRLDTVQMGLPVTGRAPTKFGSVGETFRSLISTVRSSTNIADNTDMRLRTLVTRIGCRYTSTALPGRMSTPYHNGNLTSRYFPSERQVADVARSMPRSTVVDGSSYTTCGVIENLARAYASTSWTDNFNANSLTRQQPVQVTPLNVSTQTIATDNAVYLTNAVLTYRSNIYWYLLILACIGVGSTVFVAGGLLNAQGQLIVPTLTTANVRATLPSIIADLTELSDEVGEGGSALLAMFRGINQVNVLVSHTDEGGAFRDVFKTDGYEPSSFVWSAPVSLTKLAICGNGDRNTATIWLDSHLLRCGAALQLSDRGLDGGNGARMPSFSTGENSSDGVSVQYEDGVLNPNYDATVRRANLVNSALNTWKYNANNYCSVLAGVYGLSVSTNMYEAMHGMIAQTVFNNDDRHFENANGYYMSWIEPTNVFSNLITTPALEEWGGGMYCGFTTGGIKRPAKAVNVGDRDDNYTVSMYYNNMRTNGWMSHFYGTAADGNAYLMVKQAAASHFANCASVINNGYSTALAGGLSIGSLAWNVGDNPLPKVQEAWYGGSYLTLEVVNTTYSLNGNNLISTPKLDLPNWAWSEKVAIKFTGTKFSYFSKMTNVGTPPVKHLNHGKRIREIVSAAVTNYGQTLFRSNRIVGFDDSIPVLVAPSSDNNSTTVATLSKVSGSMLSPTVATAVVTNATASTQGLTTAGVRSTISGPGGITGSKPVTVPLGTTTETVNQDLVPQHDNVQTLLTHTVAAPSLVYDIGNSVPSDVISQSNGAPSPPAGALIE